MVTALKYANEVRPADQFVEELVEAKPETREVELTDQLIGAMTVEEFELTAFRDAYVEKLTQVIKAKVKGRKVAPHESCPASITPGNMPQSQQSCRLDHSVGIALEQEES